jgi:hypothetical protein
VDNASTLERSEALARPPAPGISQNFVQNPSFHGHDIDRMTQRGMGQAAEFADCRILSQPISSHLHNAAMRVHNSACHPAIPWPSR